MTAFEMSESFSIDNGELAGLSPQQCFVLGYELAQVSAMLVAGEKVDRPVHPQNRERLERAAKLRQRDVSFRVYHDDWLWMTTEAP